MEDALALMDKQIPGCGFTEVLILVLMEDALARIM